MTPCRYSRSILSGVATQTLFSEHDPEDVDSDSEDHAPDAGRYGLMTRVRPTVTPMEVMPSEYAQATIRAEHDERERGRSSNFYAELSD